MEILELIKGLSSTNNNYAYNCLQRLEAICKENNSIYVCFDEFCQLLQSKNSYQRVRAFRLVATCAKWDKERRIDNIIHDLFACATDNNPICARQCISLMPLIADNKPYLQEKIATFLCQINLSKYKDNMQSLIIKDIKQAVNTILYKKEENNQD